MASITIRNLDDDGTSAGTESDRDRRLLERAVELAREGMRNGRGGPFGAVIARGDSILAEACNAVTSTNDPTAHAEVAAIRRACDAVGDYRLEGCTLYASCEPCPMCLGAILWARVERVVYASTRADAARGGFDDEEFYRELAADPDERRLKAVRIDVDGAADVFDQWLGSEFKRY